VSEAARVYAAHWRLLTITAAIAFVALDLVAGVVWPVFAEDWLSATVAALVTIGASYYYQGMVAIVVAGWRRQESPPGIWRLVTGVPAVKLMAVDLLGAALLVGGFALAVLPGLVVLALTAVVAPVTALERPSISAAFRRSATLVRPSFSSVLAIAVGLWAIVFAVTAAAMLGAGELTGGAVWGHWLGALCGNVLVAPISAAIAASVYFELARSG
jgi:hypothetical protein